MTSDALTITLDDTRSVRSALRSLDGRATLADISAKTGLVQAKAEAALRQLLEVHQGHLEVGELGDIVYRFDKRMLRRDQVPLWERVKTKAWEVFKVGFKVWIVAMLVIYFLVFMALLIAAIFANRDDDGGGLGGGGDRHGGGGFGNFWLWYWLWSPGWGRDRRYYGERYDRRDGRKGRKDGPPFYKKVFAFVFGPDRPDADPARRDRSYLRIIRSRKGVITAAEMVQATGLGLDEAEEELARLMAAHDGEAHVTDEGTLVYTFPALMVSAHGQVAERRPPPAWRRLEPKVTVTGNSAGTNVLVAGLNGFNLVAAASAPVFIFPRLGISGLAAEIALIWVPLAFSATFFAVPAIRSLGVAKENAKRAMRNVRRIAMGLISKSSLVGDGPQAFEQKELDAAVEKALGRKGVADSKGALDRLVAEFDGEVEADGDGAVRFRFPGFRQAVEAAHRVRMEQKLELREVGRIVYDSADDDATAGERELESWDEALATGSSVPGPEGGEESMELPSSSESGLAGYLEDPNRFAFRDEAEIAALEDLAKARQKVGARR